MIKDRSDKIDMYFKETTKRYELQFPDSFYSSSLSGWFCKVCTDFAAFGNQERPFTEILRGLGDHPINRVSFTCVLRSINNQY